jgi:hypothetical protein
MRSRRSGRTAYEGTPVAFLAWARPLGVVRLTSSEFRRGGICWIMREPPLFIELHRQAASARPCGGAGPRAERQVCGSIAFCFVHRCSLGVPRGALPLSQTARPAASTDGFVLFAMRTDVHNLNSMAPCASRVVNRRYVTVVTGQGYRARLCPVPGAGQRRSADIAGRRRACPRSFRPARRALPPPSRPAPGRGPVGSRHLAWTGSGP